jgi:hypothetical protein
MGKIVRRLQGIAVLAALGYLGWELAVLATLRVASPELRTELRDRDGPDKAQVFALPAARGRMDSGAVRVLLARAPVEFDPSRSILTFGKEGAASVVPGNARTILVHGDRRFEVLATLPPAEFLDKLQQAAQAARPPDFKLRAWFQSPPVAAILRMADERLRRFWD